MSLFEILPLAFVMVAGPQILTPVFLATSENWRQNSAAYVFGAAISISLVVTIVYFAGAGLLGQGTSNDTLYGIILILLVVAMVHVYWTREEAEPPQWMGKLTTAKPRFAFRLGFLLLGFFPTDILTSSSVGSYLAAHKAPLTDALPFIGLTLLFLALPALILLAFGERAEAFLPKARDWMNTNSWVISEIVILLFIGMTISNLTG